MEISHPHFSEITRMVFIQICTVMMLTAGHTTPTGMLAMFAHTAVAGGDVPATMRFGGTVRKSSDSGEIGDGTRKGGQTVFVFLIGVWASWLCFSNGRFEGDCDGDVWYYFQRFFG